jgi:hypothetical protein
MQHLSPAGLAGTKVFTADGNVATITTASAVPTLVSGGVAGAPAGEEVSVGG